MRLKGLNFHAGWGAGASTMFEAPMTWPGLTFHAGCAYDLEKHATIPSK